MYVVTGRTFRLEYWIDVSFSITRGNSLGANYSGTVLERHSDAAGNAQPFFSYVDKNEQQASFQGHDCR